MNLYQTAYDLIVQYVFAGQGVDEAGQLIDQMQHLVAVQASTIIWVFLVSLPFVIVLKIIIFLTGSGWGR